MFKGLGEKMFRGMGEEMFRGMGVSKSWSLSPSTVRSLIGSSAGVGSFLYTPSTVVRR